MSPAVCDVRDKTVPDKHHRPHTIGNWLPQDHRVQQKFVANTIKHVKEHPPSKLHPTIEELKQIVNSDTRLYMLASQIFDQIPRKEPYIHDPTGLQPEVRDFDHLCLLLNHVITTAPNWTDAGHRTGLVGVPMNALLDWPMGTSAGYAFFLDPAINAQLKKILNAWGAFLSSPKSAYVLGEDKEGWFSPEALKALEEVATLGKNDKKFDEIFICKPGAPSRGYTSWDDFFTRHVQESHRPIAEPENDDIISNACESRTYKVAHQVKAKEKFWLKGQPYSVQHMLHHDKDYSSHFVGGTVYQAFLSALSYHRWHAPVSGTIKKAYVVDGTYFSEPLWADFKDDSGADPTGEVTAQEYLTAVATRAIVFIESDNPKIGLMCFIGIGMTEVSTCDITVKDGQKVKRGDELGMFHFGGSSHCLLFRKGVKIHGFPEPGQPQNVPVRGKLATVG